MTSYSVTIAVTTDPGLDDSRARDVAAAWAAGARMDLVMTSTSRDEPWIRLSAMCSDDRPPVEIGPDAAEALVRALRGVGVWVAEWETIEIVHERELQRRAEQPTIPPMVTAAELAEMTGVRVQRIYQLESERSAGKRDDFPAPVLDGHWLRSVAEHYASTRKRRPGPAPRDASRPTG